MITREQNITETLCVQNDSFVVRRFDITGTIHLQKPMCLLATVVEGSGKADGIPVQVGSSFLIPAGQSVRLEGEFSLLTTAED